MTAASLRARFGPAMGMAAGLVVVGLAGYGFLALAGHTLSTDDAAALSSFYLIISIVGPGVFAGLEQETSRSTSAWLTAGRPFGVIARRAVLLTACLLAAVLAALLAASPLITQRGLAGQWGLFAALLIGVVGAAAAYLVRGLLGGRQRFSGYAATLGGEGASRILLCLVVVLVGSGGPTAYGMVFAIGLAISALVGLPALRRSGDPLTAPPTENPPEALRDMARGLGLLVGATLGFQTVANVAPVLVTGRLAQDTATAAAFASAFVLVRVPVLLFAAVQAMLLPALTQAATRGDLVAVRATLTKIVAALAAIGVPTVVLSLVLGPWAVGFLFDAKVRLSGGVVALLAVSSILLMLTQVLLPALIAIGRHRVVMVGWTVGGAVLLGFVLLHPDPVWGAVWGQMASCGLVVVVMAARMVRALRASAAPTTAEPVLVPEKR